MRTRSRRLLPVLLIAAACTFAAFPQAGRSATPTLPYAIAELQGFRGRIEYVGRRTDRGPGPEVAGTLVVDDGGWILEEAAPSGLLHADARGAFVQSGGNRASVDDPLDSPALVNAWAFALAQLCCAPPTKVSGRNGVWTTGRGLRAYLDATGERIVGIVDDLTAGAASFTFQTWSSIDGIRLPHRILRLRGAVADASFQIERYTVVRAISPPLGDRSGLAAAPTARPNPLEASRPAPAILHAPLVFPWRQVGTVFGLLLLGLSLVAWTRREGFIDRLCTRLAADPRGWRDVGTTAFVSPEGLLYYERCLYRVGLAFYGRAVRVQKSPLFLRVSAADVSRAVVLARKFRAPGNAGDGRRRWRGRPAAGLSLLETLLAMALFALVVVGGVYPSAIAIARAQTLARERSEAVVLARNALSDEETACAYGSVAPGTTTTAVGRLRVTVDVQPADVPSARAITVTVSDDQRVLVRASTLVGPPVPPPAGDDAGGPGGGDSK